MIRTHHLSDDPLPVVQGIPMPTLRTNRMRRLEKTLRTMKVGDSFLWDDRSHIFRYAKRFGVVLTTKRMDKKTIRVWKVA